MKVYLLNYADDRFFHKGGCFRRNQLVLNQSAIEHGIENIVSWTWEKMVKTEFYKAHKEYLDRTYFDNGRVFKSYIVSDLLEKIDYGDVILYYDCGKYPIKKSIRPLVDLCVKNNGTLFHEWGDRNLNWTKRDAFVYMGCDKPRYHNAKALQNTWFLVQKNDFTVNFVKEWLYYNLDGRIASEVTPDTCWLPPLRGFIENRGDQSIFTNLALKYGIKTFFGVGDEANKNINNFIDAIPNNIFEDAFWKSHSVIARSRRRVYFVYYYNVLPGIRSIRNGLKILCRKIRRHMIYDIDTIRTN